MGWEAVCRVECPAGCGEARALLESTEVVVRGGLRWKVALADLEAVEVKGGTLVLTSGQGEASFELGEKLAAKWAEKIRNPPSLMKKLGIKPGTRVAVRGRSGESFLAQIREAGGVMDEATPEVLFVFAETESDLQAGWNGADSVWAVYPKGRRELTEAQVIALGRAAGMKDTKVASVSAELTGLRFSRGHKG